MQTNNLSNRSAQEVQAELSLLAMLIDEVPAETYFGDSNSNAIQVQIGVLRGGLTFEAIDDIFDIDGLNEYIYSAALDAAGWLYRQDSAPSEDWLALMGEPADSQWIN